jgi:hypothetical protein
MTRTVSTSRLAEHRLDNPDPAKVMSKPMIPWSADSAAYQVAFDRVKAGEHVGIADLAGRIARLEIAR